MANLYASGLRVELITVERFIATVGVLYPLPSSNSVFVCFPRSLASFLALNQLQSSKNLQT